MKLKDRTILITGGTSGMGLELAKQLLERDRRNTVIITGRSDEKLESAKRALPGVHTFKSDVGDPAAIALLRDTVLNQFPALDTLINNAGIMRVQMKFTGVTVVELIPPGVETPLFRNDEFAKEMKVPKGMEARVFARKAIAGIEAGKLEIRPGLANVLKIMSRMAPGFMLNQMGKMTPAFGARSSSSGALR